jgi:hypothetical protein
LIVELVEIRGSFFSNGQSPDKKLTHRARSANRMMMVGMEGRTSRSQ